ncbi:MAG: hypothetical protein JSS69_07225 [Acidobacteria bacterium]|nr:hypothetical protein [Acidobacteriota bacterium]MBS1865696.1 hypothetical protein [Acidobacteriota bacterium]
MKNKFALFVAAWVCAGFAASASAQEAMLTPPKVLVIAREVVKTGKSAAHEKWEAGWPRAFSKVKWPVHYLAASAVTGESRVLFFTGYESLAAWEQDAANTGKNAAFSSELQMLAEKDADFISETKTAAFLYMPDLSYKAEMPLAGLRGFVVTAIHVKPGHGQHFEEIRKIVRAAHEKANLDEHYSVYRVRAGAPAGTYLIFIPVKSLAEADNAEALHGKAYQDAMGDDGRKAQMEFQSVGVESAEVQFFAFSPKMSYVSKEWIDSDKDFWSPKPAAAMKPAAKTEMKEEKKP